jgi:2'-5' RNA ligase
MTSRGSVARNEPLRLFLALRLPDDVCDVIDRWGLQWLRGGRRVAREDLHVTLAFLGNRPWFELDAIVGALERSVDPEDEIALSPSRWRETERVGMVVLTDETGGAGRLAGRLHAALATLGVYRPERRRWLAHLTVQRHRARPGLAPPLPDTRTFVPSDAAAFLSRLHPTGARYEVLATVPLRRPQLDMTTKPSTVDETRRSG